MDGTHTSGPKTAYNPLNPLGPIPMMVKGVLLSLIVRPTMSEAPPNRPCHAAVKGTEYSTTGAAPGVTSCHSGREEPAHERVDAGKASRSNCHSRASTKIQVRLSGIGHGDSRRVRNEPAKLLKANAFYPTEILDIQVRHKLGIRQIARGHFRGCVVLMAASSEEFATGSGFNRRVLMIVKTAVFAPMPSARVSAATAVNPGAFRSMRAA